MKRFWRWSGAVLCAVCLAGCGGDTDSEWVVIIDNTAYPVLVENDVKYGEGALQTEPNLDLLMDIYTPDDGGRTNRAALILVHGGAWVVGNKTLPQVVEQADFFASRGFVVCAINYRKTVDDPVTAPEWWSNVMSIFLDEASVHASYAAAQDTAAAVRCVRAHADELGISPEHIFISGSSAGAFNAVHIGLDDPALYDTSDLPVNNPGVSSHVRLVIDHWGGSFRRSTIDVDDPPVLIIHGTEDPLVPYGLGVQLADSLTTAGVAHQFVTLEGAGHAAWDATYEGKSLYQVALEFIAMHGDVRMESADSL